MAERKVVVTGLGVVSSIGIGKDTFWENLLAGKSGISKVDLFDTAKFKRHYGGEIKDFTAEEFVPQQIVKFLGRASCFAIAAAKLALKDAGIALEKIRENPTAVIMGVTIPEGNTIDISSKLLLEDQANSVTKKFLLNIFSPSIAMNVGHILRVKGENLLIPTACAAGNYAIGYGFDLIQSGKAEFAIAGGSEALSRIAYQGFQKLYAMAMEACSPFDKNRKGMLLGEGAGILILESLESALKRKAKIYAEVCGYGLSCDAYHITAPKRDGIKKAMRKAVENSGVALSDINYISAHGTGTGQNDKEEASAIKELFADMRPPTSSIKSMLGHCMGAASAIEAIACCLALTDGMIPATMNFSTPDPECDIDCVPNVTRKAKLNYALNNAFAFGGNNCCVVFGRQAG